MILKMHSNASYLLETKARSHAGGHFYMGDRPSNAILNKSTIMQNVLSSATEAEYSALFDNTNDDVSLQNTLKEMGHPQPLGGHPCPNGQFYNPPVC
jgi:hypothetical protein